MEEAPAAEEAENSRPYQLLLLSARSQSALETAASNMAAHLKKNPGINLGDAAYTMATGRKVFKHRMAVICRDVKDAVRALDFHRSKKLPKAFKDLNRENITYMFPGLGNQYVNMALELYSFEQVFRNEVEKCSGILRPVLGMDICRVLYPGNGHIKPVSRRQFRNICRNWHCL
jgi:acyl transferase domain-containing protein